MQINQKRVALAVGAALAGFGASAQAASLSDNGTGAYLSYPYYSVSNGNDTYISVVNSTASGKIVKVRFREAKNSKEVLDFNLFLSKNDVWAAAIVAVKDTTGAVTGVQVKWSDTSCTVPAFTNNTAPFTTGLLTETDGGIIDNSVSRITDGHLEIIEMATVDPATALGGRFDHGTKGVPADCAWLNVPGNLYTDSSTPTALGLSLPGPSGGLFGGATVINVAQGTSVSYDATALNNAFPPNNHFGPASDQPNAKNAVANASFLSNGNYYRVSTAANVSTSSVDGLSLPLQKTALLGEWAIDTAVGLSTDVVVTLSNRYAYSVKNTGGAECGTGMYAPFSASNKGFCKGGAPETVIISQWDREEQVAPSQGFCPSPILEGSPCAASGKNLPWETNVLNFGASSNALSAAAGIRQTVDTLAGKQNGWFRMNLGTNANFIIGSVQASTNAACAVGSPIRVFGLPADGFIAQKYVNGNVGGVLSNYGVNFGLKSEKAISCP
jgi:hypothetical protein